MDTAPLSIYIAKTKKHNMSRPHAALNSDTRAGHKKETMKEAKWPSRLFVSGIDTDAGKSYAAGWLANLISSEGKSVVTQKFVQTGNKDFSEDIAKHRELMGIEPTPDDKIHLTAPVILSYPCSPELAARLDGTEIDTGLIAKATEELSMRYSHVIIEGAGGLMVPLKGEYLTIDYIREHCLPVALVTNGTLGSISHTLLSLYAIKHHGIELWGVIYNKFFDNDKIIAEDTRNYINNWIKTHFPDALYLEMPKL